MSAPNTTILLSEAGSIRFQTSLELRRFSRIKTVSHASAYFTLLRFDLQRAVIRFASFDAVEIPNQTASRVAIGLSTRRDSVAVHGLQNWIRASSRQEVTVR
jgi:hypothetical protein